jgi:hypothetical protein
MGGRGKDFESGGSSGGSAKQQSGLGEAYKAFSPSPPIQKADVSHVSSCMSAIRSSLGTGGKK